tara:strand:- start:220 stop:1170 length:951 start_codon:yes stop_codon:yes gene_type:complete
MIKKRRSFIIGIKGTSLKKNEIFFLKKYRPWGVILFSRNIKSINQTKNLTKHIKKIFNDKNYPILIDQEGGRVSRINKFIDTSLFTAEYFGNLYNKNKRKFNIYLEVYIKQVSYLLKLLGININTVPVLDVRRNLTNKIIYDRSYSKNPKIVSNIGKLSIKYFHKYGIGTVIKHIPGHGLSKKDSHINLPIVKEDISTLNKNDFYPFKKQKSILAMTAHIIYKSIDDKNTATHSKKVIKLIRKKIGFKKIIISDDISMKALKYSIKENTIRAFSAGCNIVLHCNGNYKEMINVGKNSPLISDFILKKTSNLINIVR